MLSLALLVRLADSMQLVGTGHCPDPVQVEQRLEALSEPGARDAVGVVDEIDAREIRLRLLDANGAVLAERNLRVGRSCAARSQASAVVFAAWQTEFTAAVPVFPEPPLVEAHPVEAHVAAVTEPPRPATLLLELGAGVGAGFTADQVEPGLRLEAALLRSGGAWSAELGVTAGLPRQEALGAGGARWLRSSIALSGAHRWNGSTAGVHLEAGAVLTYVAAHGVQLAATRSASAWDAGLRTGVRLVLASRPAPWLLLDATFWPLARSLEAGGAPAPYQLPHYEIGLAIGGSLSLALKGSEAPAD
jgi:hypothetical protein